MYFNLKKQEMINNDIDEHGFLQQRRSFRVISGPLTSIRGEQLP